MLDKLKRLKVEIELLERYVDDSGLFLKVLDPGVRYSVEENKMEVRDELE